MRFNHPVRRRPAGFFLFELQFWASVIIIGFFSTMMFLLWKREAGNNIGIRKMGFSPDLMTVTWVDYDQYMWIERGGKRVGAYMIQVTRTPDGKNYKLLSRVSMALPMVGQVIPLELEVYVVMNEMFEMDTLQGYIETAGQKFDIEAFAEGRDLYYRMSGPEMLIRDGRAGGHIVLEQAILLADAIRPVLVQSDRFKVGSKWSTLASDPLYQKYDMEVVVEVVAAEKIEIEGEVYDALRVTETIGDGTSGYATTTSWYDDFNHVLKTDMGNGLVLIRARQQTFLDRFSRFGTDTYFDGIPEDVRAEIRSEVSEGEIADAGSLFSGLPKF